MAPEGGISSAIFRLLLLMSALLLSAFCDEYDDLRRETELSSGRISMFLDGMDHNIEKEALQHMEAGDRIIDIRQREAVDMDVERSSMTEGNINLLFITADQLRYDALQFIQSSMSVYQKKLKVRTPNIDRLASEGVYFSSAYCQSSSCAPARATLRSGCTMSRTGVHGNSVVNSNKLNSQIEQKIAAIRTYDQILNEVGYQVESYGKLHLPRRWLFDINGTNRAVLYNSYALDFDRPVFSLKGEETFLRYSHQLRSWMNGTASQDDFEDGQQINRRTRWPYSPLPIDPRYGLPTASNVDALNKLNEGSYVGIDSLPPENSQTTYTGTQGVLALRRLAQGNQPWAVTVSFENPHPPFIVAEEYAWYYLSQFEKILVPPNLNSKIKNKFYFRQQKRSRARGYNDARKIQQWTAIYYAMVEQVDAWVGLLLDELETQGVANQTMVVFTTDHGEYLGGHGLQGKMGFFEEALRVPLLMRLPGLIEKGAVVDKPVAHMDVFATILDYLGYSDWDESDGKSLRAKIEGTSIRQDYDDDYVVGEVDTEDGDVKAVAASTNFMVRKGPWKLMINKFSKSRAIDMLFHLDKDPFERRSLLTPRLITPAILGKAEHLKCLLLEWLLRHDGAGRYYSRMRDNGQAGESDITEIRKRRSWPTTDMWVSDSRLRLDGPVLVDKVWRTTAWLYIGRTKGGILNITEIKVVGKGRIHFRVDRTKARIQRNGYVRVKVSFASSSWVDPKSLNCGIRITTKEGKRLTRREVRIVPWKAT